MRVAYAGAIAAIVALAVADFAASAQEPAPNPVLRFDPFERPDQAEVERLRGGGNESATQLAPALRATLVAGDASLANLAGSILRVGDEFEGYRLAEVRRGEAVFVRNGARVTLRMDGAEEPKGYEE